MGFCVAGMTAAGFGHLIAAGLVPGIVEPRWDTSWLLSECGFVGSLTARIFGHRSHRQGASILTRHPPRE